MSDSFQIRCQSLLFCLFLSYSQNNDRYSTKFDYKSINDVDWSPGLVVTGRNSQSEDCGFESRQHVLDGHFFTLFVVKIAIFG